MNSGSVDSLSSVKAPYVRTLVDGCLKIPMDRGFDIPVRRVP